MGKVVVSGGPEASGLQQVMRHALEGLKMLRTERARVMMWLRSCVQLLPTSSGFDVARMLSNLPAEAFIPAWSFRSQAWLSGLFAKLCVATHFPRSPYGWGVQLLVAVCSRMPHGYSRMLAAYDIAWRY